MTSTDAGQFLEDCKQIATSAGRIILTHHYANVAVQQKPDGSNVTAADHEANAYIVGKLRELTSDIPIVAEESDNKQYGAKGRFFLVDPLDGTDAYRLGEKEFTVNIALIEDARPVLGVIVDPSHETLYWAARGQGAWRQNQDGMTRIQTRTPHAGDITIIKSRRHPSASFLEKITRLAYKDILQVSSSIKFCRVAEGRADMYPRFGTTMEWDTAAGHAILNEAGGRVLVDGSTDELTYGKPGYQNPFFWAVGKTYESLPSIASQI